MRCEYCGVDERCGYLFVFFGMRAERILCLCPLHYQRVWVAYLCLSGLLAAQSNAFLLRVEPR